jgi:tetratricopeptide (TPR) repeat protein
MKNTSFNQENISHGRFPRLAAYAAGLRLWFSRRDLSSGQVIGAVSAICVLSFLVHLPLLHGSFSVVDDHAQIMNQTVKNLSWHHFQRLMYENFLDRNHPLMYVSFMLNWYFSPNDYTGFAVVNLAILILTMVLFYRFSKLFISDKKYQLLATLLFAVHSVHVDIYAWISARCHLMGMPFFLGCFIAWGKYRLALGEHQRLKWYAISIVLAQYAMMSKNIFFMIGIMLFVYDLFSRRRLNIRAIADKIPFLLLGVVPIIILKNSTNYVGQIETPAMGGSIVDTLLNDANLVIQYLLHLVIPLPTFIWVNIYPVTGLFETSRGTGLLAMQLTPATSIALLAGLVSLAWWSKRHGVRELWYFLVFFAVSFAPVANIPPRWVDFAFRYDWIPSIFFCLLVVRMIDKLRYSGVKAVLNAVLVVFIAWHAAQSNYATRQWDTEEKAVAYCTENFPDAVYCVVRNGQYHKDYDKEKAIELFKSIDQLTTDSGDKFMTRAAYQAARTYEQIGDTENARIYYVRALRRDLLSPNEREKVRAWLNRPDTEKAANQEKGRNNEKPHRPDRNAQSAEKKPRSELEIPPKKSNAAQTVSQPERSTR